MSHQISPEVRSSFLPRTRREAAHRLTAAPIIAFSIALLCFIAPPAARADSCSPNGTGPFNWNDPAAWTCTPGVPPTNSTWPGQNGADTASLCFASAGVTANVVAATPFAVTTSISVCTGGAINANTNGSLTITPTSTVNAVNVSGGTLAVSSGGYATANGNVVLASGTITLNGGLDLPGPGTFSFNGGTLAGSGALTIWPATAMSITGSAGSMLVSGTSIDSLSTVNYTSPTPLALNDGAKLRAINASGALVIGGSGAITTNTPATSAVTIQNGARLTANASTTIQAPLNTEFGSTVTANAAVQLSGGGSHFGTFVAQTSTIRFSGTHNFGGSVVFNSPGGSPLFRFDPPGQFNFTQSPRTIPGLLWTGGTIGGGQVLDLTNTSIFSGALAIASGTTVRVSTGTLNLGTTATIAGPGLLNLGPAAVAVNGSPNVINAPVTISSPTFTFGTSAQIDFMGGGTINGGTFATTGMTQTFRFGGPFLVHSATFQGPGAFVIPAGGTFVIDGFNGPVAFIGTPGTVPSRLFLLGGTIVLRDAVMNVDVSGFEIRIDSPGMIDLQNDVSLTTSGAPATIFNNGGTFRKSGGTLTSSIYPVFTNAAFVVATTGVLDFVTGYTQSGGRTTLAGGTVAVQGGTGSFTLNSGYLEGNGTFRGSVTHSPGGYVAPGSSSPVSTGIITITGSYSQTGALMIKLAGTTPGTGYDRLNVTGPSATIGGGLSVTYVAPFTSPNGQAYDIFTSTAPRSGMFSITNYPAPVVGWKTNYLANAAQIVMARADLSVTTTAPTSVTNGQNIVFNTAVTNNDPTLTATSISVDGMSSGPTAFGSVTSSPGMTCLAPAIALPPAPPPPANVSCTIATLAPGATATVTLTATTTGPGTVSNTATAFGTEFDPNTGNNSASIAVTVNPSVDLGIAITDTPDPVLAGANTTYTINVTNSGLDASTNGDPLVLTLTGGTIASLSGPFTCTNTATTANCTMASIAAAASASMTLVATAGAAASMSLSGSVGDAADTNPANDIGSQPTVINPAADLVVSQSASPGTLANGQSTAVTVALTNNGPSAATAIPLTHTLSGAATITSATTPAGTCSVAGLTVNCAIASLPSGASALITINLTATAAGSITGSSSVPTSAPPLAQVDPNSANNTTSPLSIIVNPSVDLGVTITDSPDPVLAGTNVSYTITVANTGPDASTAGDSLSLTLTGGTIVSVSPPLTCSTTATTATCTMPAILPATSSVATLIAKAGTGGAISLTGTAADANDGNASNNSGAQTTAITAAADLAVSQITSAPTLVNGQSTTVTVTLTNNGPSAATAIPLTHTFSGPVTVTSATTPAGTCGVAGLTVTCTISSLPSGASTLITINLTATAAGTVTSSSSLPSSVPPLAQVDPNPANNATSPLSIVVDPSADVSIAQSASPSLFVGQNAVITLAVTNNGPSAAPNITINDTYSGASFVSVSATGGTICSGTLPITCSIESLAPAATATVTITLAGTVSGTISNSALATSPVYDGNKANNNSTMSISVGTSADLTVTTTASPDPVYATQNATVVATIKNLGPSPATKVTFADSFSGATAVSATTSQGTCTTSTTVTCSVGDLASGATATVRIVLAAKSNIQNIATVSASESDPNASNNSSTLKIATIVQADVSVTKSGPASASPGAAITYTITVFNDGPSTATAINVTDPTPAGLTPTSVSGACTALPCTISSLPAGSSATISAAFTVTAGSGAPAQITNTVFALANNDPNPSNDSASSTTAINCTTQPPEPLSPLTGAVVRSPVTFSWTAVTNATLYEVFVTQGATLSVGKTSSTSLNGLVNNGPFSWYVVATTPDCGLLTSSSVSLNACNRPDAPLAGVVANAASGQTYSLQWNAVDGAASYEVQEAINADFTGATTQSVNGTSVTFSHVTTTIAQPFFYRVCGVATCDPQQKGAWSAVDRVVIAPIPRQNLNPNANVPVGSTMVVVQDVPIAGIDDGNVYLFNATVDKPWMAVNPSSGVLPASGIVLHISADPTSLPNGTFTGTLIVTISPATAASSNTVTHGTTSVAVPVSISLVTPVTPTNAAASANSLIIPSVGHLDGRNSQWRSDVRVANPGSSRQQFLLTFAPTSNETGVATTGVKQTTVSIDAGATVALDDIAHNWFGVGSLGEAANGVLMIRSLDAPGIKPGLLGVIASSRTYSVSSGGTLGQYIPAIPFASFIGTVPEGSLPSVLSLQHIAQSANFRTNVGMVEAAGAPANVILTVFDSAGKSIRDVAMTVNPFQQVQLNAFLASQGIALDDGRIEVRVAGGGGKVTAYASVVDNHTNDPLLVSGAPLNQTFASRYVLPGVADLDNSLACWRSDVRIFNGGTAPHSATLTLYPLGGGTPLTASETLDPGEVTLLDGAVESLFGVKNVGGALHITTTADSSLVVTGRTYNAISGGGTVGQYIPAVTSAEAVGVGGRALQILQVEDSPRYRTNLGIAEVTGQAATAEIMIHLPDSKVTPLIEVPLNAYEYRQFPIIQQLGLGNVYNVRISVNVVRGGGKITAYGSVIDQQTQDPTYVPAQ